ncbi:methyl-accepting chemotaxis protein [Celerinatantimonas sp. YJH-8]|uniref:methyl-accepting chemotaxis protein n=1 Tax=Celerinatantimonas sp. YJH-8 TaxID=3228714 RepID=UPI0038CA3DCE
MARLTQAIENLSVGSKLGWGFGLVLFFTFIVAVVGHHGLLTVLERSHKVSITGRLELVILEAQKNRSAYIRTGDQQYQQALEQTIQQMKKLLAENRLLHTAPADIANLDQSATLVDEYEKSFQAIVPNIQAHQQLVQSLLQESKNLTSLIQPIVAQHPQLSLTMSQMVDQVMLEIYRTQLEDTLNQSGSGLETAATVLDSVLRQTESVSGQDDLHQQLLTYQNNFNKYQQVVSQLQQQYATFNQIGTKMSEHVNTLMDGQVKKQTLDGKEAIWRVYIISCVVLVIGATAAWLLRRMVIKPLAQVVSLAEQIAKGDLTADIHADRRDEFGKLLSSMNVMNSTLGDFVRSFIQSIEQLGTSSEKLVVVCMQGNENMATQSSETEQVATAMNEMTSTVHEVANNAAQAALATNEATDVVAKGHAMVDNAATLISRLAEDVAATGQTVDTLNEKTNSVSKVLEVIKTVADQTNLLALNAAIEAARAGEAGRGFAVVADEVRNLASRTQESAVEIEVIVEELQAGAARSVNMMKHSEEVSKANADEARNILSAFNDISSIVGQIQDMNQQIAAASEQQGLVSEEINQSVVKVRDISYETAQSSTGAVEALEKMQSDVDRLKKMIAHFVV